MRPMPELEVVKVATDELLEYENNAKLHPMEQIDQIASSIEEFGFNSPILAWHNNDGEPEIVAGHGRLMAARKIGMKELPVVFLDHMSDEQRRAYILVDNQMTMNSGFDEEILNAELSNIDFIDMTLFDFSIPKTIDIDTEIHPNIEGDEESNEYLRNGYSYQDGEPLSNYEEQYGVIVYCESEPDQERVYNALTQEGMNCRVVAI